MAQAGSFVNNTRQHVSNFLDAYNALLADRKQYDALGGAGWLGLVQYFYEVDGEGNYTIPKEGVDIQMPYFVNVFVTLAAVEALMDAGHATNLYTAKP